MKRIDFTKLGGLHTYQDTLEFMQDSYRNSLASLAALLGDKFVVSGCIDNGVNVTDGWICVSGELIPFTGGALAATVVVSEAVGQEGFEDASLKDVYYTKTATLGIGGFPYADLKRLPFGLTSLKDFTAQVKNIFDSILQFEAEVILSGCEVTDVDVVPGELAIGAGLVLFNGSLLVSETYNGVYPAYLKDDGAWVTAEPVAGLFIKFDPYTSQRYVNVLDRAMTPAGRIVMMETLNDRFVAEVGRWEMKGYELVSALQNRVPVGLWYDGIPVANVSDALNSIEGSQYGERTNTLLQQQLPDVKLKIEKAGGGYYVNDTAGGGANVSLKGDNDNSLASGYMETESLGDGDPHNNMQPSTVVVYAKRVA
ncbi:hypothetical protein ESA94_20485 [Lacibacter luteus]|uniref:Phage tail collar domain-containing protein n=1 Tax=Lacibacter luteus TaxID=2508719 RepID=A0A4Q1CDL8_9BACT|nr:hypothetical protein [Lacibacter luteus]RXK57579.1 hypothetical protein ESA94_20485 [Lacibacter luteus]